MMLTLDDALYALDLFGVGVFAVSGTLKAAEKNMDIFGCVLIAAVTGIGGGTLRDVLLGASPVFWVARNEYLGVCAAAALAVFAAARGARLGLRQLWLTWADALGLAIFCVIGARAAMAAGAPMAVAVLMGVMTATFGGVIRDLLCAEIPLILQREIYATAAAAGAAAYVVVFALTAHEPAAIAVGLTLSFAARAAGIVFGLSLPSFPRR